MTKRPNQIDTIIDGNALTGYVTDSDMHFLLALLAEDSDFMLGQGEGMGLAEILETIQTEMGEDESADQSRTRWINRLNQRISINNRYREMFCQRMIEIFPDMPCELISHETFISAQSTDREVTWRMRIDVTDVFSKIIIPMMDLLGDEDYKAYYKKKTDEIQSQKDAIETFQQATL